jgi:hypothetical protein
MVVAPFPGRRRHDLRIGIIVRRRILLLADMIAASRRLLGASISCTRPVEKGS